MEEAFLTFIVFAAVCACIYCGATAFFSFISGWRRMSLISPAPETVQSDTVLFSKQTMRMGFMTYTMCIYTRFTDAGVIFSTVRPFAFMHKPFIIPYEKISNIKVGSSGPDLEFTVEGIKITLEGESAAALKKKKRNPSLPVASLKRGRDDADISMKRGEQKRSTRRCRFYKLQPVFITAVRDFIKSKKLGGIESTMQHCFETTNVKKWFFGTILRQFSDMVITPKWFFWGVSGDQVDTSEGCAKIKDIAKNLDIEKILLPDRIEIQGINITGFHYDESRLNSWVIYVGEDKAGEAFKRELRKAVRNSLK